MSTLLGVRSLNRSAKVGIGVKDLVANKTTWVNTENSRVIRDLARHTSIGQLIETQPARYQLDTAQVSQGGLVTARAGSVTLDISASSLTYVAGADAVYTPGTVVSVAATTQAVSPNATNPLVAAIGYDTSTPATPTAVALNGTAAATVLEGRFKGAYATVPANPAIETTANRTWLALVWVPPALASVTGVATTGVVTTGSAHNYNVGDQVWFSDVTGSSAGISTATVYYVRTVPSSTTFTLSATSGGSLLTWTGNLTAAVVQRQILSSDVVDVRP